jgi:two-component system response regulator MprA
MAVHVLYADDEPALRELVQNHLSLEGYEVETAGDGAEAIRILEKTRIDLAILDIHMPNVDGIEVLKYMKSHGIKSRLIVLTGDSLHPYHLARFFSSRT